MYSCMYGLMDIEKTCMDVCVYIYAHIYAYIHAYRMYFLAIGLSIKEDISDHRCERTNMAAK